MRVATLITGVIFVGWLATLGMRLSSFTPEKTASDEHFVSQVASVFSAFRLSGGSENALEVAPSDTP